MKRLFTLLVVTSLVVFALPFNIDKTFYGGQISLWPFPFYLEVGGFYEKGTELYTYSPYKLHVDGFVGPSVGLGLFSYLGFTFQDISIWLNADVLAYSENLSLDIFNIKFYPAIYSGIYIYYNVFLANIPDYILPYYNMNSFGFGYKAPALVFLMDLPEKGKNTMYWYVGLFPITIGAAFLSY